MFQLRQRGHFGFHQNRRYGTGNNTILLKFGAIEIYPVKRTILYKICFFIYIKGNK